MGVRVLLVLLGACVIALPSSARADDGAEGRRHAKRASHLSASGKCKQAVAEYDKALAAMHDPALLFNRGECHRKLGNFDAALADYDKFLADLPKAPNRAEVQARIAEMRKASATATSVASPASAVSGAGRASSERSLGGVGVATPPPARLAPSPTATMGGGPAAPARAPLLGVETAEALGPNAPVGPGTDLTLLNGPATRTAAVAGPADDSLTGHAWFWVAVAAAAVGVGVGTYAILSQEHTSIPPSPLGNYRF